MEVVVAMATMSFSFLDLGEISRCQMPISTVGFSLYAVRDGDVQIAI